MERINVVDLENVRIEFRNFSGVGGRYNPEGNRKFCVMLNDRVDLANRLSEDGWNIKWLQPRDDEEDPCPYLTVKVSFKRYPPTIYMVSDGKLARVNEDNISNLDFAEIVNKDGERNRVDLQIAPYTWDVGGKGGIAAYCKTLYVPIATDPFRKKYIDIPDDIRASNFPDIEDD